MHVCMYPLAQTSKRSSDLMDNLKDILDFLISHYAVWCMRWSYLHIKQIHWNISRLKWDTLELYRRPIFITSKVLSNKRVFFKSTFSFHKPFNNGIISSNCVQQLTILIRRLSLPCMQVVATWSCSCYHKGLFVNK